MRHGPHTYRPHSELVFRGSRKRVGRIKWRGNSSPELWLFLILILVLLVVVIPWMMSHSAEWHHHDAQAQHQPTR
jgi:hypothetical protein